MGLATAGRVEVRVQVGGTVRVAADARLGAAATAVPQLFTFSSSTSKISAVSPGMSRPAPRLP
jgi:hypothetical protein